MVNYLFMPLHRHYDYGFGATGEAFKSAADRLAECDEETKYLNMHLPINFLYRHAIELFLKSLVIVIHKRLKLPFGNESCDSMPMIPLGPKWKPIHQLHSIGQLYEYFKSLVVEHKVKIQSITRTNWSDMPVELERWISTIENADSAGTFFRYPVTKDRNADKGKSSFKESNYRDIFSKMGPEEEYTKAFLVLDENEEIVKAYEYDNAPTEDVRLALKEAAEMLSSAHFGMRHELAGGD